MTEANTAPTAADFAERVARQIVDNVRERATDGNLTEDAQFTTALIERMIELLLLIVAENETVPRSMLKGRALCILDDLPHQGS